MLANKSKSIYFYVLEEFTSRSRPTGYIPSAGCHFEADMHKETLLLERVSGNNISSCVWHDVAVVFSCYSKVSEKI